MEYINTNKILNKWGSKISEDITNYLIQKRKVATGALANSIDYEIYIEGKRASIDITFSSYGRYVLSGRKPQPYLYKRGHKGGTSQFISAIEKWIRNKKIPVRLGNPKTGKPTGQIKKLTKYGQEHTIAFAIANSINKRGIRPFNFLKPYQDEISKGNLQKEIREAIVLDIKEELKKQIIK